MRSLLFHCKDFGSVITGLSTRPEEIVHGEILDKEQSCKECVLVFITVEKGDTPDKAPLLASEIVKFADSTKHYSVFICPFAHLSNNLAKSADALPVLEAVVALVKEKCSVMEGHFGSDKELLIHLFGHPGNARYREF